MGEGKGMQWEVSILWFIWTGKITPENREKLCIGDIVPKAKIKSAIQKDTLKNTIDR